MKIGYLMQVGVPNIREHPLSGPANHVVQFIKEFANNGNQVKLIATLNHRLWTSDDLNTYDPVDVPALDHGIVRLIEKAVRRLQSTLHLPYFALFESLRFATACKKLFVGYDVLYERMGWFGYGGALASKFLNIPLVLEVNGDHISELEMLGYNVHGPQFWLSSRLMAFSIHQASMFIATGEGWKKRLIERWQVDPARVVVVENGTEIVQLLRKDELRSFNSDTHRDHVTVIYVGGFEPWHGITILIKAFYQLISCGVPAKLILVGSGTEQARIESFVKECHLQNSVTFTGHLNVIDLAHYLAQADIGVSPYCGRVEFSGLKLLDYKAGGLATIASGENGEPAVIEHGRTGLIIPPCDDHALFEALYLLCTDSSLRIEFGKAARVEAEALHSWKETAHNIQTVLSSLDQSDRH